MPWKALPRYCLIYHYQPIDGTTKYNLYNMMKYPYTSQIWRYRQFQPHSTPDWSLLRHDRMPSDPIEPHIPEDTRGRPPEKRQNSSSDNIGTAAYALLPPDYNAGLFPSLQRISYNCQ